jgi:hypothetical protein
MSYEGQLCIYIQLQEGKKSNMSNIKNPSRLIIYILFCLTYLLWILTDYL